MKCESFRRRARARIQFSCEQAGTKRTVEAESHMRIVDSHAHLESEDFDADRAEMLARAHAEGVEAILAIGSGGSGPDKLDAAISVAKDYDWIYASIGIHPQHAAEAREEHYPQLAELAKNPKVIAWGEIGLDYHWPEPARETQHEVFRRQLSLARDAVLPIIIHCRDAWDDCLAILESDWAPLGLGGILHCFTGTLEDARRGLDMGFMVSFAANSVRYRGLRPGSATYRRALSTPGTQTRRGRCSWSYQAL